MTITEQFQDFNYYTLGNFFVAYHKGKIGVFHSYVDTGFCYGYRDTLEEAEKLRDELNEKHCITVVV